MTASENINLPFLQASYQKDLGVLFCRWQRPVSTEEYIEGNLALLDLAASKNAHFWLQDLRRRNTAGPDEKHWFATAFAPALRSKLGSSIFFAYLMSPLQHNQITAQARPNYDTDNYRNKLVMRFYTNEHDALECLYSFRHYVEVE